MYFLKTPCSTTPLRGIQVYAHLDGLEARGQYSTLDEAIQAALTAGMDLAAAVIEKNGCRHPVNEWITFRITGGAYSAG
jgi:hypothetical protein